jgi:CrcB protein
MHWLAIFAGGGIGALMRFELGGLVQSRMGATFPWGTFAVNALGCFAIGLLAAWVDERAGAGSLAREFWIAGVVGGFTTFSTFGLETVRLLEAAQFGAALANAAGSVVACLVAVVAGFALVRAL